MKQPSLCTAAYVSPLFVLLVTITVLMTGASDAWGYEAYSTDKTSGYCADCHGGFRSSPYTSLAEGANWGDDLHDVHRRTMLSSDCSTCHGSSRFPVSLDSSSGGVELAAISCVGCHGRDDDMGNDSESAGRGAGLRQAHTNSGVLDCTDCHSDADPENYTPVGEDVLPNYYANPANHPVIPTDSCNANGEEGAFAGSLLGLDNDGDTVYDTADSDCAPTGCQSDAECDDAMFCNGTETCNVGTGQCEAGTPVDVDDGVGCTDDSCDEANDVVVNTPNDGLCDNGQFCDGSETCDAINDCQAGTAPCDSASETCDEAGDMCEPVELLDLDVASLKVKKRVSLTRVKPVVLKLVVKNTGTVEGSALATITGMLNGVEVYNETLTVTDSVGNGRTTYDDASVPAIPPFVPTVAGDILWTVTLDDDDPDIDEITAVTTVVP
jgi:hypothetical protein